MADNVRNETADTVVTNNAARHRYEIDTAEGIAFLRYREGPVWIDLIHTEVPEELSGRGIGGKLAKFALDDARARGLRVIATCPFVRAYVDRHPAYAELTRAG